MSSNQALLLNKLKQILTERKQLFQGKVLTLEPLQVIITSNNQIVGCTKLNNVTKNQSVAVFKDLDNKKYYCFSPEVSVINLNSSVVTYNSFNKRRGRDVVSKYNIYFFLLDVSNSIEMGSIDKCLQILNNEIEHTLNIKRNDLISIIPFSDTVYEYSDFINKPTKKNKVIEILNNVKNAYDNLENKYDRYIPSTFDYEDFNITEDDVDKVDKLDAYSKFWVNEGTDLPENGIDAINEALDMLDRNFSNSKKYFYLITDNEKYSSNVTSIETLTDKIETAKIKQLIIDIIENVNQECLRIGYVAYFDDREEVWLQTQIGEEVTNLKLAEYYYDNGLDYSGIWDINVSNLGSGINDYVVSYMYSNDGERGIKRFSHPNSNLDSILTNNYLPISGSVYMEIFEGEGHYTHRLNRFGYGLKMIGNGYGYRSDSILSATYTGYDFNFIQFSDNTFNAEEENIFYSQYCADKEVGEVFKYHLPIGLDVPMNGINSYIEPYPVLANQIDNLFSDINLINFETVLSLADFLCGDFVGTINSKPTSLAPFSSQFVEFNGIKTSDEIILGEKLDNNEAYSPYKTLIETLRPNVQYTQRSSVWGGADLYSDNCTGTRHSFGLRYSVSDSGSFGYVGGTQGYTTFNISDYRDNKILYYTINKSQYLEDEITSNDVRLDQDCSIRGDRWLLSAQEAYYLHEQVNVSTHTLNGTKTFPFNHTRAINTEHKKVYSKKIFDPQFNGRYFTPSPDFLMQCNIQKTGDYSEPLIVGNQSFIECTTHWESDSKSSCVPTFSYSTSSGYSGYTTVSGQTFPIARDIDEVTFNHTYYYCLEDKQYEILSFPLELTKNTTGIGAWRDGLGYDYYTPENTQSLVRATLSFDNPYNHLLGNSIYAINSSSASDLRDQDIELTIDVYNVDILPLEEGETQEKCRIIKSPRSITYQAKKVESPELASVSIYSVSYYTPQELKELYDLVFSESLVLKEQEENPYCSTDSVATSIYLEDDLIGKYSLSTDILRQIRNYLLYKETGSNLSYFSLYSDITNLTHTLSLDSVYALWDSKYQRSFSTFSTSLNTNPIYTMYLYSPMGGNFKLEDKDNVPEVYFYNSYIATFSVYWNGGLFYTNSTEIYVPLDFSRISILPDTTGVETQHSPDSIEMTWNPPSYNRGITFLIEHEFEGLLYYQQLTQTGGGSSLTSSFKCTITSKTPTEDKYFAFKNNDKVYFGRILDTDSFRFDSLYKLEIKEGTTVKVTQYFHSEDVKFDSMFRELLKINGATNREIFSENNVKVICDPTVPSSSALDSDFYKNTLPPSDTIIYPTNPDD